ncbi:MAG: hypothetical protein NVV82_17210 [Sporocytophaga sp.]|nr:hypothetical protein [Sporocytophaga sp.]
MTTICISPKNSDSYFQFYYNQILNTSISPIDAIAWSDGINIEVQHAKASNFKLSALSFPKM